MPGPSSYRSKRAKAPAPARKKIPKRVEKTEPWEASERAIRAHNQAFGRNTDSKLGAKNQALFRSLDRLIRTTGARDYMQGKRTPASSFYALSVFRAVVKAFPTRSVNGQENQMQTQEYLYDLRRAYRNQGR